MKDDLIIIAVAALMLVGLVAGGHELGWSRGFKEASSKARVREEGINSQHNGAIARAERHHRDTEAALQLELAEQQRRHQQEITDERNKRERFAAAVRSGSIRLSIPVASRTQCGGEAGAGAAAAAADRHEERAELAPETGLALTAIADDGNDAIRQLNACIDHYDTVRARLNAPGDAQAR